MPDIKCKPADLRIGDYYYNDDSYIVRRIESMLDGNVYYQDTYFYAGCKPQSFCAWAKRRVKPSDMVYDVRSGRERTAESIVDEAASVSHDFPMMGFPQARSFEYVPRQTVIGLDARPVAVALAEGLSKDPAIRLARKPALEDLQPGRYFLGSKTGIFVRRVISVGQYVNWMDQVGPGMCSPMHFRNWCIEAVTPDTKTYQKIWEATELSYLRDLAEVQMLSSMIGSLRPAAR